MFLRNVLYVAFALTLMAGAAVVGSCRSQQSRSQRQLTVAFCGDKEIFGPVFDGFGIAGNVKLTVHCLSPRASSDELIKQIAALSPAPDVFVSSEVLHTVGLARKGQFVAYTSFAADKWPPQYRGAQQLWYGFGLRARVLAYSTKNVGPLASPKRIEDLANPNWKGKLAMVRPLYNSAGMEVASWMVHYGPGKAGAILENLQVNEVQLANDDADCLSLVSQGKADVALVDSSSYYLAASRGGLDMNLLDQGDDGPLTLPHTVAMFKRGQGNSAAGELISFIMSGQCEIQLADSAWHCAPTVLTLPGNLRQYAINRRLAIDYDKLADNAPAAVDLAERIFKLEKIAP